MPSPNGRATFLEVLPEDLQVRVLACLSTKERAALPLVCKAFERLANAPGSLLWDTLDLRVTPQHEEAALQSGTRRLLRARGQRTQALRISVVDVPEESYSVFATSLPPLCPQLQQLTVGGSHSFSPSHASFITKTCRSLTDLDLELRAEGFMEALTRLCESTGLTCLKIGGCLPLIGEEDFYTPIDMQPLLSLTQLRRLELCVEAGDHTLEVPASLPSRLPQLEYLRLEGIVKLPVTLGRLQGLTALGLNVARGWANLWPAVSGVSSLRELSVCLYWGEGVPPVLHPAAFSTGLTGLTCTLLGPSEEPPQEGDIVAGSLLALPALRSLVLHKAYIAPRLDWSSFSSLQCLSCKGLGPELREVCKAAQLLRGLTCLAIGKGRDVTDEAVAELFPLTMLRRLELRETEITVLPELVSKAQLTALILDNNGQLSFSVESLLVLEGLSSLRYLHVCLCKVTLTHRPTSPSRLLSCAL